MGEPNRAALIRLLRLRPSAEDSEIVAAIRKTARSFRRFGRPFVLAPDLTLNECLEAIRLRKHDEIELSFELFRQGMALREKEKSLNTRCLFLDFLLDANGTPLSALEESRL